MLVIVALSAIGLLIFGIAYGWFVYKYPPGDGVTYAYVVFGVLIIDIIAGIQISAVLCQVNCDPMFFLPVALVPLFCSGLAGGPVAALQIYKHYQLKIHNVELRSTTNNFNDKHHG